MLHMHIVAKLIFATLPFGETLSKAAAL
jgi:hypothetical protein